jgi:putative phosphoribosyl transferase
MKIKECSHHYWDLVRKYAPDYQDKEDWIRASRYSSSKRDYELNDMKNIVLVDDGAATGATVIAAARWIRRSNNNTLNQKLIIAVPVAPKDTIKLLKKQGEADHIEVITAPSTSNFRSVGQYYQSFEPVSDEQVLTIMRNHNLI